MARLTFTELGVVIPTTEEHRADVIAKIRAIFVSDETDTDINTDPTSPMGQLIDAWVAELEAKDAEIAYLANQLSAKQASGANLDALNSLYFLERKKAAATVVQCLCTGAAGTQIPFGAMVADSNGNRFRLLSLSTFIGPSGTVLADFVCTEYGPVAVQAGTVNRIVTTVPGWDEVTNPAAGAPGRLRESDAEFRERAKLSVAANAHGTAEALRSEIAALDDVIDCEVLENFENEPKTEWGVTLPGHSVAVCVEGGSEDDLAAAIYSKKDLGCSFEGNTIVNYTLPSNPAYLYTYKILRPTSKNLYVRVVFATPVAESVAALVREAILRDAAGESTQARVGLAQQLYASRFWGAVAGATTVPIASVKVRLGATGSWSDSLTINADIEPVFSDETIIVESE